MGGAISSIFFTISLVSIFSSLQFLVWCQQSRAQKWNHQFIIMFRQLSFEQIVLTKTQISFNS